MILWLFLLKIYTKNVPFYEYVNQISEFMHKSERYREN